MIKPYTNNLWYWQYRGEPVLLIGGTDDDNLFQWTGKKLTDHLDLLVSVGGNYVRNTMSDRDEGNVYAFGEVSEGKYDLDQWNAAYWNRLQFFLDETSKRGVIAQLTLWDQFDLGGSRWTKHPWNPENNINLEPGSWNGREDFNATVAKNDKEGLRYQEQFVRKIVEMSLASGNVLFNINNESSEGAVWENYWAQYVKQLAEEQGKEAHVTSMQIDPSSSLRHCQTYQDLYSFIDISQNNQDSRGGRGQGHWDNIMYWRQKIASYGPMPMNNEKVYGSGAGPNYSAGTENEAMHRFWRNIFAGCASSRFHRPAEPRAWGSGLNERVQTNLKAMRMLLDELDIFSCSPHNDLLSHLGLVSTTTEAYATANIGQQYAVYFPSGRFTVDIDPWIYVDRLSLRWLDIDQLAWSDSEVIEVQWDGGIGSLGGPVGRVNLTTPSNRPYVALLEVVDQQSHYVPNK